MKKVSVLVGAILFLAADAVAAEPEPQETPQPEKRVCKSEKVTGSLTRVRRICMTQREWDEIAASVRKGVNDLDRQANTNSGS